MNQQQPYPYEQDGPAYPKNAAPRVGEPSVTHTGYATEDQRAASILAHLSAPIAAIVSAGWVSFLGPLIVWFLYKDRSPAVRQAAAGAFNFNVSFSVMYVIGWIFAFTFVGIVVAIPLWIVIFLVALWCHVKGALRSARGQAYEYPFQIRILN